jgi:hypothetical protein
VSLQMLLDLVILGVLVRVLVRVTNSALATAESTSGDDQDELRGGPDQ